MTEDFVTKAILRYLIDCGWRIVSFDFPHRGTGRALHPCNSRSKNSGVLIPDVIAVKGDVSVYMENKDHYSPADFNKVHDVLQNRTYADSFRNVLGIKQQSVIGGIGLPEECCSRISPDVVALVDFVLKVGESGEIGVHYVAPGRNIL